MRVIESGLAIDASAADVWSVLVDGAAYPEWNPFITRLEGECREGERLRVTIKPPWKRRLSFRPRVTAVEPDRRLAWEGHLLVPGLFDGYHEFRLDDRGADVRFTQRETFRGVLVPLLLDEAAIERGFEEMNEALKARVEGDG